MAQSCEDSVIASDWRLRRGFLFASVVAAMRLVMRKVMEVGFMLD